ncbi:MAG: uracil-DNA glycosylase [Polyangiaceae bacterium]|nr:uracil-DNA glycosylase [Polyangiaceae bacterium]
MDASLLPPDWAALLDADLKRLEFDSLLRRVADERASNKVYPPEGEVFAAFHETPVARTRVVLLGQDPYHGAGQAHGLAFSVARGVKAPPSLVNMFKELEADLGHPVPKTGCLLPWAQQGVLLLNTLLTVREAEPGSHKKLGWEPFTDAVISKMSARAEHVVFVLWGNHARKKSRLVDTKHTIVEGAHPSPLSAKLWFGSRPFSKINEALRAHGQHEIAWQIADP